MWSLTSKRWGHLSRRTRGQKGKKGQQKIPRHSGLKEVELPIKSKSHVFLKFLKISALTAPLCKQN